jgi:uncharacterized protein (DUF924 family)
MDITRADEILKYWFKDDGSADFDKWFMNSKAYDNEITEKFGELLKEAEKGNGFGWLVNKNSFVAYIILMDQFSRHIYRDTADAFKNDISTIIFTNMGFDLYRHQLVGYEFMFAFMPYMHTESLEYQNKGEKIFNKHRMLYDRANRPYPVVGSRYHLLSSPTTDDFMSGIEPVLTQADKDLKMLDQMQTHVLGHKQTIEQFGRFPKRNEALSRDSTQAEINYIRQTPNRPY